MHTTIAGVLVAWTIPLEINGRPILTHMEVGMKPWIAYGVVPTLAFFNSGIHLSGISAEALLGPASPGAGLGLFIGKPIGVFGAVILAVITRLGTRPRDFSWLHLFGASLLANVGFMISLFVAALALETPALQQGVTLSVIIGSSLSALAGLTVLMLAPQSLVQTHAEARVEP